MVETFLRFLLSDGHIRINYGEISVDMVQSIRIVWHLVR